jgi:hypothetical protein
MHASLGVGADRAFVQQVRSTAQAVALVARPWWWSLRLVGAGKGLSSREGKARLHRTAGALQMLEGTRDDRLPQIVTSRTPHTKERLPGVLISPASPTSAQESQLYYHHHHHHHHYSFLTLHSAPVSISALLSALLTCAAPATRLLPTRGPWSYHGHHVCLLHQSLTKASATFCRPQLVVLAVADVHRYRDFSCKFGADSSPHQQFACSTASAQTGRRASKVPRT